MYQILIVDDEKRDRTGVYIFKLESAAEFALYEKRKPDNAKRRGGTNL